MFPMTDASTPQPTPTGTTRHWLVVVGAALIMTCGVFVFLSTSILNPPLAESLGVGLSEVMVFNSLMSVTGMVSMMFTAPWIFRRIGVRAAIVVGGLWMAAAMTAVSFVGDLLWLYLLGLLAGLSLGISTSMAASLLVNTWFEARRGTLMGAVFAVSGLGGIGAGLILPAVVEAIGWQGGFRFIAGLIVVLVVLPALFLIRSHPARTGTVAYGARLVPATAGEPAADLPGVPARIAFRTPQFVAIAAAVLLFAGVQAFQMHFAPVMVERGVTLVIAGTLLSLMALTTVFTNVGVGTLNDRYGTAAAVLVAMAGQTAAMVGYLLSAGFAPLAVSTVLFAVGAALPGVLIPIIVMQVFGVRDYPAILGPVMAMIPAGMAVGTPLWGLAVDATGSYSAALGAGAVVTVASAALMSWALRSAPSLRSRVERKDEPGREA